MSTAGSCAPSASAATSPAKNSGDGTPPAQQGREPAHATPDYADAGDLARLLGDAFTIELHAVEPRVDPPPDHPHIAGVVLRARRR
jgi:hypothetical protein